MTHLPGYENIKVIGARVVIRIDKEEEKPSGLLIISSHKEPKFEGKVVAVGTGSRLENGTQMPMEITPGDQVIYSRMAGVPVNLNGEELLVINERDVIAIIG